MDIYRNISRIKDNEGNLVGFRLINAYGDVWKAPIADLKRCMKDGEVLVTNLRISDKGNIIDIKEFIGNKKSYFLAEVSKHEGVFISALVADAETGLAYVKSANDIKRMIQDGAVIYGARGNESEQFNIWAADIADLKPGTPLIHRDSVDRIWQCIYLGKRYDRDYGETRFMFFDGETPDTWYYEVGTRNLIPITSVLEVGVLNKWEYAKLVKKLKGRCNNADVLETAKSFAGALKRWKQPIKNKWNKR